MSRNHLRLWTVTAVEEILYYVPDQNKTRHVLSMLSAKFKQTNKLNDCDEMQQIGLR